MEYLIFASQVFWIRTASQKKVRIKNPWLAKMGISKKKCNVFPLWLSVMDDRMTVMIWNKALGKKKKIQINESFIIKLFRIVSSGELLID